MREHVAALLADSYGHPVRTGPLELIQGGRRADVYRVSLEDGPPGTPRSVILKHFTDERSAELAVREWTGLRFLDSLPQSVGPRPIGRDPELPLVVLEDLGVHQSLADRLLGDDPVAATTALHDVFGTLGRVHAASIGRSQVFDRIHEETGGTPEPLRPDVLLEQFRIATDHAGVDDAGAKEDLDDVLRLFEPSGWTAFSPSDVCPDNNALTPDGVRLFDLEGCGFRHALWDGSYCRILMPSCWCVGRLPDGLPQELQATYRRELAAGCPESEDDDVFEAWMVRACAAWTILSTGWLLPWCLEEDLPMARAQATFRSSIGGRLSAFERLTEETARLGSLGAWAGSVRRSLEGRWPAEDLELDLYPAFAQT